MNSEKLHGFLGKAFGACAFLTLLAAPTQKALQLRKGLYVSAADLLLAAAGGLWLLHFLTRKADSQNAEPPLRSLVPPWPFLLFTLWCGCAAIAAVSHEGDGMLASKEFLQTLEYFVAGAWIFNAFLRGRNAVWGLAALFLGTVANVCVAAFQYRGAGADSAVAGTYTDAAVFGGLLCLTLPFAMAGLVQARHLYTRISCGVLLVSGLFVVMDGAAHLALMAVFVAMAALSVVPRAFAPHGDDDLPAAPKKARKSNGVLFFVAACAVAAAWQGAVLPRMARTNDVAHFASLALYDEAGQVNKRYAEWQAAYSMGVTNPWIGVGLGNYQRFVGQYYDAVPRQPGPSVPDSQNLYLVLLSSAGFPALFLFLACLLLPFAPLRSAKSGEAPDVGKGTAAILSAGCRGAVAAFALASVWHPLLVRGIGLPLVFLLVLAYRLHPLEVPDGK